MGNANLFRQAGSSVLFLEYDDSQSSPFTQNCAFLHVLIVKHASTLSIEKTTPETKSKPQHIELEHKANRTKQFRLT